MFCKNLDADEDHDQRERGHQGGEAGEGGASTARGGRAAACPHHGKQPGNSQKCRGQGRGVEVGWGVPLFPTIRLISKDRDLCSQTFCPSEVELARQ